MIIVKEGKDIINIDVNPRSKLLY